MSKEPRRVAGGSTVLEEPGVFESDSCDPLAFDILLAVTSVEYDPFRSGDERKSTPGTFRNSALLPNP